MKEWNMKLENVLEKRRIEVGKDDDEDCQLLSEKATVCKI